MRDARSLFFVVIDGEKVEHLGKNGEFDGEFRYKKNANCLIFK